MNEQEREYYMRRRQTLIMELGALEDLLGMERSIVPKRKRQPMTYEVVDNDYQPKPGEKVIQLQWPD